MGAYHQMGHASRNLALNPELRALYAGAITSPINEDPGALANLCKELANQEMVFDPAFFAPTSGKLKSKRWKYSAAAASAQKIRPFGVAEWAKAIEAIVAECTASGHHAICSPAAAQKNFSDDELAFSIKAGDALADLLISSRSVLTGLQTAIVHTSNLEKTGRPETVASILTSGKIDRLYIVPRWTGATSAELKDRDELIGFGKTVQYVAKNRQLLMGFCGPEMIIWKAVGAHAVATGKYANQQRFDLPRYQDKDGGGGGSGTVPYYFEESLLAWLQFEDIVSLDNLGYPLGLANDPFYPLIRQRIDDLKKTPAHYEPKMKKGKPVTDKKGKPRMQRVGPPQWTSEGWHQWLWWFADAERRLDRNTTSSRDLIATAQKNWNRLKLLHFIPVDPGNDGSWLSAWLSTLDALGA